MPVVWFRQCNWTHKKQIFEVNWRAYGQIAYALHVGDPSSKTTSMGVVILQCTPKGSPTPTLQARTSASFVDAKLFLIWQKVSFLIHLQREIKMKHNQPIGRYKANLEGNLFCQFIFIVSYLNILFDVTDGQNSGIICRIMLYTSRNLRCGKAGGKIDISKAKRGRMFKWRKWTLIMVVSVYKGDSVEFHSMIHAIGHNMNSLQNKQAR